MARRKELPVDPQRVNLIVHHPGGDRDRIARWKRGGDEEPKPRPGEFLRGRRDDRAGGVRGQTHSVSARSLALTRKRTRRLAVAPPAAFVRRTSNW